MNTSRLKIVWFVARGVLRSGQDQGDRGHTAVGLVETMSSLAAGSALVNDFRTRGSCAPRAWGRLSDAVVAALANQDRLREIGEETVKGISTSIRVYEIQPQVAASGMISV